MLWARSPSGSRRTRAISVWRIDDPQRQRASRRGLHRQPVVMTAEAGLCLARLDLRAGTHGGHHRLVAVQQLEVDEPVRRHCEMAIIASRTIN